MPTITTTDGVNIFYKDWGSGQPIVFSHGWPLTADDWDAQMSFFLRHGYRVIAHDRRGHGRSDQPNTGNDMDTWVADLAALTEHLDLREATFAAKDTTIYANAIMGGIDIIVDAHTHVIVEGVGVMGAFDQARDKVEAQITADSPVLRVKGIALMAGVTVTRKSPPGQTRKKMLGRPH